MSVESVVAKIFGTKNEREIKKIRPLIATIGSGVGGGCTATGAASRTGRSTRSGGGTEDSSAAGCRR
jgi:hypothetical protein